jgi:signal transduction histidine kinase/CheY-like chemotaxis protein
MYFITFGMVFLTILVNRLLDRAYLVAQILWASGLAFLIILAYSYYLKPEITLLFIFLPIMAEVMLGLKPTLILEVFILLLVLFWNRLTFLPPLPVNYNVVLMLSTLASTALGWGISNNLITSIEAASLHYNEAVKRLEEARKHRAEISVLLKDVNNANYQLDRMNLMLAYARNEADKAREERDRFALAVSHELRSPLNFIIGFSDLMVNSPDTYANPKAWPPGLYDDINEIYKSSTHLMNLINDILDMGKMDANQFAFFKEKTDFNSIAGEVCEMVQQAVTSKSLKLVLLVDPDLPPVFVDRTRIRQVLLNLVTNSLRFTRKGSITIRANRESADMLRVEVVDTGIGISKEDLPKVFKEFRQVGEGNFRSGEGSGLGLSIGRRFIQMHNGEMGVESEAGKGSTFFFTIPFHQHIDDVEIINEISDTTPSVVSEKDSVENAPLLLILTSDAFSARVFARSLKGYKVTILTDPTQVSQVVEQTFPRAVIIDDTLASHPRVVEFSQSPPFDLPILTFPVPVTRQDPRSSFPEGVQEYLVKPVPRATLLETISRLDLKVHSILVVDDDPSMIRFVTQTLKANEGDAIKLPDDMEYQAALDGQEALRILRAIPVGAVFLDLDLTDMNGLTLLNWMQQDEELRKIPVVIISASDPPSTFRVQKPGMFNVLVNHQLNQKVLADMVGNTLQQVMPIYGSQPAKDGLGITSNDFYGE